MKKLVMLIGFLIVISVPAYVYAVAVSLSSVVNVTNAPAGSVLNVSCGTSTGVYTITKQFNMGPGGTQPIVVGNVIPVAGNWFCISNFTNIYGVGPNSTEFNLTVSAPSFVAPTFTVVP
jgi:hypothetical protein